MTDAELEVTLSNTEQTERIICAICYEPPTKFGLMVSCDHIFCLECISIWRREGHIQNLSGLRRRQLCPVCRTYSELVVETSIYLTFGEEKDLLIKEYVHRLAKTPCQYFMKSPRDNRHCPFGDSCYYQHLEENGLEYGFSIRARRPSVYERTYDAVRQPSQNNNDTITTSQGAYSIFTSLVNFFSTAQQRSNSSSAEDHVSRDSSELQEHYLNPSLDTDSSDSNMIFLMTMTDL